MPPLRHIYLHYRGAMPDMYHHTPNGRNLSNVVFGTWHQTLNWIMNTNSRFIMECVNRGHPRYGYYLFLFYISNPIECSTALTGRLSIMPGLARKIILEQRSFLSLPAQKEFIAFIETIHCTVPWNSMKPADTLMTGRLEFSKSGLRRISLFILRMLFITM